MAKQDNSQEPETTDEPTGKADRRPATSRLGDEAPRWLVLGFVVRERFAGLVLAGFLGCLAVAGVTLLIPNTFRASSSLILDRTSSIIANDENENENAEQTGMPDVSVPTIVELLKQPQIAYEVLRIVESVQNGEIDVTPQGVKKLIDKKDRQSYTLAESVIIALSEQDRAALQSSETAELLGGMAEDLQQLIVAEPKIEKKLAFDVVYSPLIYVQASAQSPELARMIANVWVTTFTEYYDREIARKQLQQNKIFIQNEYDRAKENWVRGQKDLQDLLTYIPGVGTESDNGITSATLPSLEKREDELTKSTGKVLEQLLEAERDLTIKERRLTDVSMKLETLTGADGNWVGQATLDEGEEHENAELTLIEFANILAKVKISDPIEFTAEDEATEFLNLYEVTKSDLRVYNELRAGSLSSKKHFMLSTKRLQNFEQENRLEEYLLRRTDATMRFNEYIRRIRKLEIDIKWKEQAMLAYADALSTLPQTVSLQKVLPLDVLYLSAREKGASKDGSTGVYTEEMLNPSWEELDVRYRQLIPDVEGMKREYLDTVEAKESTDLELRDLQLLLSKLQLEEKLLNDDQEKAQEIYFEILNRYNQFRSERFQIAAEVLAGRAEIRQLRKRLDSIQGELNAIYSAILNTKNQSVVLESEIEESQSNVERLRMRLIGLETRLSEDSRQIKVATPAITPELKVWPPRTVLTLAGGCLAALFYLFVIIVGEELRYRGFAASRAKS